MYPVSDWSMPTFKDHRCLIDLSSAPRKAFIPYLCFDLAMDVKRKVLRCCNEAVHLVLPCMTAAHTYGSLVPASYISWCESWLDSCHLPLSSSPSLQGPSLKSAKQDSRRSSIYTEPNTQLITDPPILDHDQDCRVWSALTRWNRLH